MPINPLAETVAKIRKRLGESQEQFGRRLKIRQATVSKYELGLIVPGALVLMQLTELALPAEKPVFAQEIGRQLGAMEMEEQALADSHIDQWEEDLKQAEAERLEKLPPALKDPQVAAIIQKAFQKILGAKERKERKEQINNPLSEIQSLWTQYRTDQRAVEFFRDAAAYLRVRLSGLK